MPADGDRPDERARSGIDDGDARGRPARDEHRAAVGGECDARRVRARRDDAARRIVADVVLDEGVGALGQADADRRADDARFGIDEHDRVGEIARDRERRAVGRARDARRPETARERDRLRQRSRRRVEMDERVVGRGSDPEARAGAIGERHAVDVRDRDVAHGRECPCIEDSDARRARAGLDDDEEPAVRRRDRALRKGLGRNDRPRRRGQPPFGRQDRRSRRNGRIRRRARRDDERGRQERTDHRIRRERPGLGGERLR